MFSYRGRSNDDCLRAVQCDLDFRRSSRKWREPIPNCPRYLSSCARDYMSPLTLRSRADNGKIIRVICTVYRSLTHIHWRLPVILEICRPRTRIHNWPTRLVHKSPEFHVSINHFTVINIASVHFDEVNTPLGQALSVYLQVIYRARIPGTSLCSGSHEYFTKPSLFRTIQTFVP